MSKKQCYYEVLGGLDRKCDAQEIKTAYRKLALKLHPDKAMHLGMTAEEATAQFQVIQEAYSVLSDPQERAWYDSHREQILRGDDGGREDPFKTKINLYKYFSASCYKGFDDKPGSFFNVYAELFEAIDKEEEEWDDADEEYQGLPRFGTSTSPWSDVSAFYKRWMDFSSRKAFGHADKWNPREAENRQVRRAMEQENKKARQAAKKEFNAEVRQLVQFAHKRDPRVAVRQKQQAQEAKEKAEREAAEKERKKATEKEERQARKEAQRLEEEARYQEFLAAREERRQRGEAVSDDDEDEESEEVLEYVCEYCRKSFKSEKAFDQHLKSKKHLQTVAAMKKHMDVDLELEKETAAKGKDDSDDDDDDLEAGGSAPSAPASNKKNIEALRRELEKLKPSELKKRARIEGISTAEIEEAEDAEQPKRAFIEVICSKHAAAPFQPPARSPKDSAADSQSDEEDDGDDSDEDAFLTRFANKKGGDGKQSAKTAGASESSDDDDEKQSEDGEPNEDNGEGGSKKARQREKQKAVLLEKARQREGVEELVKNTKKAQRAAKKVENGDAENVVLEPGDCEDQRCAVCKESFSSRTKLFQHIKATGHAALKEAPLPQNGREKKSAKKKGK
eukprot:TRINITY_DN10186_c0_g5_i1.p1 TRINITY_DN10186_c0_g5~~TRINITY_DN10186_c0_g5_i1.p1  ORF type:complete len:621 (-),score=212.41 TRINITY_DN10186_c0_g5_i1:231-2093(-)